MNIILEPLSKMEMLYKNALLQKLQGVKGCYLTLEDSSGKMSFGKSIENKPLLISTITVKSGSFYKDIALKGSVGAGESYFNGDWETDDLVSLVRILVLNRDYLDAMETGLAKVSTGLFKVAHAMARNTLTGSKKNIEAHYDLGNDLFKIFLSPDLMYSSAIYKKEDDTLEIASEQKLERICQTLKLSEKDHVLEIGTGWGGFALYAAQKYGCRVTTTTISKEQYEKTCQLVWDNGLENKITPLLKDYRELEGVFDKAVSIEMVEAIGHQYMDTYFNKISSLLKNDGAFLIQAIVIEGHRYKQALNSVDFIKKHIFPGSFIPSVSALLNSVAKSSNLNLVNFEDIGLSYAKTLHEWRKRFLMGRKNILNLGYDERFIRMWDFYFAYCEGGFLEKSISDVQMLLAKPNWII